MTEKLYGSQMPRLYTVPPRHTEITEECPMCAAEDNNLGCGDYLSQDVLDWAPTIGYELDPWQKWAIQQSLGIRPDGKWVAKENAIILSRQNGKGTILEIRELGGLFVIGEELIIHTAHQFNTAIEHFRRIRRVVDNSPALRKRVKHVSVSNGKEAIELHPQPTLIFGSDGKSIRRKVGGRLQFLARSKGSGRGFSSDCLVYDEAMILTAEQVGASMPTMSAKPNPQIYYMGSAGLPESEQFGAIRKRIVKGGSQTLFGAEWSINPHTEDCPRDFINGRETNYYIACSRHDDRDLPESWAKANPAYGYRISEDFTRMELEGMPGEEFDRERLGVGEWPIDEEPWAVLSKELWGKMSNPEPGGVTRPIVMSADIDDDGKSGTIICAWDHHTGPIVLEIPKNGAQSGTDWILGRMDEIYRKTRPLAIALPKAGPGAALLEDGKKKWGDRVKEVGTAEEAAAFAWFTQQAKEEAFWHFGEQHEAGAPLWHALGRADTRTVGDGGKAWSRRDSESDITPVTSATLAAYYLNKLRRSYDPLKSIG